MEINDRADALEQIATQLIDVPDEDEHAQAERDLARALLMWSLELRDLASAGRVAWQTMSAMFPGEDSARDRFGVERAQAAILSTWMMGDIVLDAFAWAELRRRGAWSPGAHRADGKVDVLWVRLLRLLDAEEHDPMTGPARFLDVTLDAARDMLVAHRDPELALVRGTTSFGSFSMELVTWDEDRLAKANTILDQIQVPGRHPPAANTAKPERQRLARRLEVLIGASRGLNGADRLRLREAYRWGGFDSPSASVVAAEVVRLCRRHLELRGPLRGHQA